MVRWLLRKMASRPGRWVIALLLVVGMWIGWWLSPATPLRSVVLRGTYSVVEHSQMVGGGNWLFLKTLHRSPSGITHGWHLIRISDGHVEKVTTKRTRWGIDPSAEHLIYDEHDCLVLFDIANREVKWRSEPFPLNRNDREFRGSEIRFSSDGQCFAAEADSGVSVFETLTGRRLATFAEAAGPCDLSADGTILAANVRGESAQVAVWNVTTQTRLATLSVPEFEIVQELSLSRDGTQVAAKFELDRASGVSQDLRMDNSLVWSVDRQQQTTKAFLSGSTRFSQNGQFLVGRYAGTAFEEVVGLNPLTSGISPNIKSVSDDGSLALNWLGNKSWAVSDLGSGSVLAQGHRDDNDHLALSPRGRRVVRQTDHDPRESRTIIDRIRRLVRRPRDLDPHTLVYDSTDSIELLSVPRRYPTFFNADESTIWMSNNADALASNVPRVLEEYSLARRGPPAWLWSLTTIALFVIGIDAWRWQRQSS